MSNASYAGLCSTEPLYDVPFTTEPKSLTDFLVYLEARGVVQPQVECHAIKRIAPKDATMPTFDVTNVEKVGFKINPPVVVKGKPNPKAVFAALTPSVFTSGSKVRTVFRCKYEAKESIIVPLRPVVMMTGSSRIPAKTIIQLNNIL